MPAPKDFDIRTLYTTNQETFLCSNCKTEQRVDQIEHPEGLKACLCPNCREDCCEDYCHFFLNGEWNDISTDMFRGFDSDDPKDYQKAVQAFNEACERREKRYAETKQAWGIA